MKKLRDRFSFWNYLSHLTSWQLVLAGSISLTAAIMGIRYLGWLQPFELMVYDQMMRMRPEEGMDERLLIVTISDKDIQELGKYPIEDTIMAKLLSNINRHSPIAIGLLLLRDLSYGEGREKLAVHFKYNTGLVAVCKYKDPTNPEDGSVGPPPESPEENVTFSNIKIDDDGVIRRHLFYQDPGELCLTSYAYSIDLAMRYLGSKDIKIGVSPDRYLQLGNVILDPLNNHTGFYHKIDDRGHQILLNYRSIGKSDRITNSAGKVAEEISIIDILEENFDPNLIRGKIVLIGVTSLNTVDSFLTPYGTGIKQVMPGVVVHAHMTSQIISAVLDDRPLLWFLFGWQDAFFVWSFSFLGLMIVWKIHRIPFVALATGSSISILYVICFVALWKYGLILPIFPSAVALLSPTAWFFLSVIPVLLISQSVIAAARHNPAAIRETIESLMKSPNRTTQRVGGVAISGILQEAFSRCQTVGDIVATTNQLEWIPSPPPPQVNDTLTKFLEASQDVRAAENSTTNYRKKEALEKPIEALIALRDHLQVQHQLFFRRTSRQTVQFIQLAKRWIALLQTAQQNLEETARKSGEIPNPYIAGPSLDPDREASPQENRDRSRFKGRQDIFREIEQLALSSQPPILLLYGTRRSGKTSALKYLPRKVGADIVPLVVDLQGIADATTLVSVGRSLADKILEAARKSRNLQLPDPDYNAIDRDPFPALRGWFTDIEAAFPNKRFLLCLDEFERLSETIEATHSKAPLNFFRHVMQHRSRWIVLFSGSHTLDELDDYWSDYLINTQFLRLTYLQESEARELIVEPIENFPDIYTPGAIDRLIYWTRCQPYLVQLSCQVLVEYLNRNKTGEGSSPKATVDDVEAIVPKAIETGMGYFNELWRGTLSEPEREFVRNLIATNSREIGDRAALRKLIQKEVLERGFFVGGTSDRAFQVPMVQRYFEQVVNEEI